MNSIKQLLVLLVVATGAGASQAAPPSRASVDELMVVTRVQRLTESMLANVEQSMRQAMVTAVQGQSISAEQQRVLDAMPTNFARVMREEFSWEQLRTIYLQIYEESFSQEEIDGLLAFYKSPTGTAFIDKMPVVMQKSMSIMQARMGPMLEKMSQAMRQAIEDAKAVK